MFLSRLLLSIFVSLPFGLPLAVLAQGMHAGHGQAATAPAANASWTDGVVRSVHKTDGQITISHEPLVNLGMGKMTMTFRLKSPALADGVKEGSKVRFVAENVNGELTVVALQLAK